MSRKRVRSGEFYGDATETGRVSSTLFSLCALIHARLPVCENILGRCRGFTAESVRECFFRGKRLYCDEV